MFRYRIPGANAPDTITYQFTGLDRRARIADGACRDMTNLTTDDAPCLSVRSGRHCQANYPGATLLLHKNGKSFLIHGTSALYDGKTVGSVTAGPKRAAVMNDWIFLWPDKAAFNTATEEFRSMEEETGRLFVAFTNSAITRQDGKTWPFQPGDGVTIAGCVQSYNNRTAVVQSVNGTTMTFYDNIFQYGRAGSTPNPNVHSWTESGAEFSRTVPALDFVCERDNRLWGVYGNHICCCKLGDGFNWNVFNGLATDAYDVTVGSDGAFTGISGYSSYILAFKEDCVHKLYGSKPSNFTVYTAHIPGVQAGCADTLQMYSNRLFYLSREGVMAFGGGIPEPVGAPLNRSYIRATAGMHHAKYYLSGVCDKGAEIVVFDTERGLWAREDHTEAVNFSSDGGTLWLLDAAGGLWKCGTEDTVEWEAVFGPFEAPSDRKRRGSRLSLILTAETGARLSVETRCDGQDWQMAWQGQAKRDDDTLKIPFLPVRGHGFSIRLRGTGSITLHAINRWFR